MKKHEKKETDIVEQMMKEGPSQTDPLGSWTGKPENIYEVPVQDADDL